MATSVRATIDQYWRSGLFWSAELENQNRVSLWGEESLIAVGAEITNLEADHSGPMQIPPERHHTMDTPIQQSFRPLGRNVAALRPKSQACGDLVDGSNVSLDQ